VGTGVNGIFKALLLGEVKTGVVTGTAPVVKLLISLSVTPPFPSSAVIFQ
jgi:hypothetical protein